MQYDLTKPSPGRIYDYWLGGKHNFEIDRQFADQVTRYFPVAQELVRVERTKVGRFVQFFYDHGLRAIIDFGSNLPTCDNTHLAAHQIDPAICVVYCDIDPITVAYSQDLLAGESNVIFLHGNAATPLAILDAPETRALLGAERRVGINFLGLIHVLTNDQLQQSWRTLYEWVAPGSYMAVTLPSKEWDTDPHLAQLTEQYRRAGLLTYYRTLDELKTFIQPWHLTEPGIVDGAHYTISDPTGSRDVIISYSMLLSKT